MKIKRKVTNGECARLIGVGRPTVTAVRKMLGIPSTARKVFAESIGAFLEKYQDFKIADADDMEKFRARHPNFKWPLNP